jgi:hypothetical protein
MTSKRKRSGTHRAAPPAKPGNPISYLSGWCDGRLPAIPKSLGYMPSPEPVDVEADHRDGYRRPSWRPPSDAKMPAPALELLSPIASATDASGATGATGAIAPGPGPTGPSALTPDDFAKPIFDLSILRPH